MLFEITKNNSLKRYLSKWQPRELDVEKFIVSADSDNNILDPSVIGEPLLIVSNQVKTKFKKRADILAIDRYGNGVIIELKRDRGFLGVETQALQYLADFSAYKGQDFIKRFSKTNTQLEEEINSFIGGNATLKDINKSSRIILLAREFDPTIYSMGEWLSNNGVAFRCIQYEPTEIDEKRFISFSIAFDRSKDILNPLAFGATAREPSYYWHNIARADQKWWEYLVEEKQIPACFDSAPGDQGEKILTSYISGDVIVAYSKGYGAIGWGVIEKPESYKLAKVGSSEDRLQGDCMHRLSIKWKTVAPKLSNGIKPAEVRDQFDIYHPLSTSVSIDPFKAKRLIEMLNLKFEKV
ncbi:MAG: hypothetical protein OEY36_06300 [Gammaproteobacteria bacterium]|nr:hypothetical protein [Gammaproteobacteria bacterium]